MEQLLAMLAALGIRPMGGSHSESTVMVLFFFVVVRKKRILSSAERGLVLVEILWQTELKTWEELVARALLIPSRESLILC